MKNPKIILYKKFIDKRGYFSEIYKQKIREKLSFVQDNLVVNKRKNTFRGLHYQIKPFEQGKLITVLKGSILDYVVKVNKRKIDYKNLKTFFLSEKDNKWLWVPPNFAHGYLTCDDNTIILYKVTKFYSNAHERLINIFKEGINVRMKIKKNKIIISKKDS